MFERLGWVQCNSFQCNVVNRKFHQLHGVTKVFVRYGIEKTKSYTTFISIGRYNMKTKHPGSDGTSWEVTNTGLTVRIPRLMSANDSRSGAIGAPFQYPIRRLIIRSREDSKPRDW